MMQNPEISERAATDQPTWIPKQQPAGVHPHMTDEFARVYQRTANRNTGQVAAALDRVGTIQWGTRVLDIAAGAGALSVPAALRGASVLAVDNAPGMVNLLADQLAPFPSSEARLMDGQQLELEDGRFDATFSLFGASLFPDWRRGLSEQARVTRSSGKACIATWRRPPGGGPFLVMAQALRAVSSEMQPPAPPEGFLALAEPDRLIEEMSLAGLAEISVEEIETIWEGQSGQSYLDDLRGLHSYMGAFQQLDKDGQSRVEKAIAEVIEGLTVDGRVLIRSSAILAIGKKA